MFPQERIRLDMSAYEREQDQFPSSPPRTEVGKNSLSLLSLTDSTHALFQLINILSMPTGRDRCRPPLAMGIGSPRRVERSVGSVVDELEVGVSFVDAVSG